MRGLLQAMSACALFAALSLGSASAQETAEQQVRTYLEASAPTHAARGYRVERGTSDLVAPLRLEGGYVWAVTLRQGVNYRVFGVCDNDCTDLDMEVYGHDGQLVDRDIALDDVPFVQITPTRTGRHYVRIWLANCSSEPCYVAARVVSGGQPEERDAGALPFAEDDLSGDQWRQVVRAELDSTGQAHRAAGYAVMGEDAINPVMLQSEGHREVYRLRAGRSYLFQGACDQDCSDVDLELLDPRGELIERDVLVNDRPVARVTPAATGDYTVRIWLAQCSVEPCYVGVRAYERGAR